MLESKKKIEGKVEIVSESKGEISGKVEFIVVGLVFIFLLSIAVIIAIIVKTNEWGNPITIDNWLIYYGTIGGSLTAGYITAVGLYITNKQTREIQDENKKIQVMILDKQDNENELKISNSAFIIENDLAICFEDMFKIVVRFSIENSKVSISQEERSEWISAWKEIIRGFEFSSNWREEIINLSPKLGKEKTKRLYAMYSMLEKTKNSMKSLNDNKMTYEQLYRNIQILPVDEIFNEELNCRYKNLRDNVGNYDTLGGLEKLSWTEEYEKVKVKVKSDIYQEMKFFEDIIKIEGKFGELLSQDWIDINLDLSKITSESLRALSQ
ncbi:hypothetical protein KPL40_05850 [Clostridium gasigenes]|uniref:hypothetical protein n=1 Tax=Clostridium gasigenes TaxID=94869 RepID=UPI001C0BF45E|nr:hypothetical protein [Clostridium gasigenes]MBU3131969.1 hypothetical protein [Clostridium gasigenes]